MNKMIYIERVTMKNYTHVSRCKVQTSAIQRQSFEILTPDRQVQIRQVEFVIRKLTVYCDSFWI